MVRRHQHTAFDVGLNRWDNVLKPQHVGDVDCSTRRNEIRLSTSVFAEVGLVEV